MNERHAMSIKENKSANIEKDIKFEQEQWLNVNTLNSDNESRNSLNSTGEYISGTFIAATGSIIFSINWQNYAINVEKLQ